MKKKLSSVKQLNKRYLTRFFIFLALVVLLEAVTLLGVYYIFSSKIVAQQYVEYESRADSLKNVVTSTYSSSDFSDIEEEETLNKILDTCEKNGGFDDYIIYSAPNGGIVVYGGKLSLVQSGGSLTAQNVPYTDTGVKSFGGKEYIFVSFELDTEYRILCVNDFTESRATIANLRGNIIAVSSASCILVLCAFLAYAYSLNGRESVKLFSYKLKLSKTGKILSANAPFKRDYSPVSEIPSPEKLDRKNFSMVVLSSSGGDNAAVALRAVGHGDKLKVYGGTLSNAASFVEAGESALDSSGLSTGSLSKLFENFILKGKRALLGVMLISNLSQIRTLFGKQMALDIQKIIVKKVKEKFGYAFELDFAYIGVAYPDGKKLDHLMADMEDVFRYINSPLRMDDNLFTLDIKAGFAMCDSSMSPRTFEHAFRAAEAAKQRAIDTKIADYIVYHESQKNVYAKYFITYDIKQMLSEGAFEMEYQPQYNIKENRIEGFEALFRVKKSWNVNVDTFSFITYAERTGAMVQLGDFIFDTGMAFAKSIEGKNVSVSLNVSPVQLMQAGFIENFLGLYKKYDLKAGSICVEITESFLMNNFTETLKKLDVLTRQGIKVHLDDFGTEYSSLLYIKKLPISTIKIDKEFVKDVLSSKESQSIIRFITSLAKLLNGTTICEGVETVKEFDMLNYLGCDTIQGWFISKSLKPDVAREFINSFDYKQCVAAAQAKEARAQGGGAAKKS